jgi:lipooligosaccharide transport system permease protein
VTSTVITPLFLVAGTFFPIDELPQGAQIASQFNPLYHLVELVRHASFGFEATDPIRLAGLLAVGLILWRVAIRQMTKRLID